MKNQPPLVGVEPNPGPRESRRLSEEERWLVIFLSTEEHRSPTAIARRLQISRPTVYNVLDKYHETGTTKDRAGRGRKRKISAADEKKIIKKAKKGQDATEIARDYERETKIKVDRTTIGRIIKDHKLKWLTIEQVEELSEENKAKRLAYARAMMQHNWFRVLFSDEKTFYLGATKTHAYQEPGKRKKYPKKRYPPKLNVWAGCGAHMKTKLYFFAENMNTPLYQKVIQARLREDRITFSPDCPTTLPQKYEFVQDNPRWHKAKKTMEILEELVPSTIIDHPPQSPDLNIMEDLWSYLACKVTAANIKTFQGLKQKLTLEWEKLPWSYIRKSVRSMKSRLVECVELEGGRTHY
jgi:transposase